MAELEAMTDEERNDLFQKESEKVSEGHLVEYVEQCVKESKDDTRARRDLDKVLWDAHETKMQEMDQKDAWQSKIVLNEPFAAVYQAKTIVRKSVSDRPDYFHVTARNTQDQLAVMKAKFWQDSLRYWGKEAGLQTLFPDMAEMAFAIGISLGAKAVWVTDSFGRDHLRFVRILPWNLHRDPDALPRDAQSGLYLVHEEWMDYHKLLEAEAQGVYQNVREAGMDNASEYSITKEEEHRRKGNLHSRHNFRKAVLVREFYGDVLDHNGELVLSKVRMVIANRTVILPPTPSPFPTLRWPIHQFSVLPSLTNFHGYSIIEGVLKMWKLRNNVLSITTDNLNFILNSAYEVDINKLIDAADTEIYPGALKYRKASASPGPAYIPIRKSGDLKDLQVIWGLTGNQFQNGSFVTELVQGQVGGRKNITKGEVEIKTQQALGVFDSIGKDVEFGEIDQLKQMQEIIALMWDPTDHPSYRKIAQDHSEFLAMLERMSPDERIEALALDADIKIRGVSVLLERANLLERYRDAMEVTENPRFAMYVKNEELVRRYFDALNIPDVLYSEEEIEQAEQQAQLGTQGQPGLEPGRQNPTLSSVPPTPMPQPEPQPNLQGAA